MKKVFFIFAMVVMMGFCANAQNDGWFKNDSDLSDRTVSGDINDISLPSAHSLTSDQGTPLGSGLLILTALGAGYVAARKKHAE